MTYTIMTEYNKVVNCSQILRDILVIASQKKSRINSKTYYFKSEMDHEKYLEK